MAEPFPKSSVLEAPDAANLARLRALGVMPREDLTGNAWKQSAVEAWLPLADVLPPGARL